MYNGKCPLCSGQLYEEGDILRCEKGHYQIERKKFEQRWRDFEERIEVLRLNQTPRGFEKMRSKEADQLLEDLQNVNLLRAGEKKG